MQMLQDNPHVTINTSSGGTRTTPAKLPHLQLQKFDGQKQEEFGPWWDSFYSLIHTRPGLTDYEKLIYLKSCLKEGSKAAQTVSGYPQQSSSYEPAVDRLKTTFGDKELGMSQLIMSMVQLPQVSRMTQARANLDLMWAKLRQFEPLGLNMTSQESKTMLLTIVQTKMPAELLRKWHNWKLSQLTVEERRPKHLPWEESSPPLVCKYTAQDFLDFCDQRIKAHDDSLTLIQTAAPQLKATDKPKEASDRKPPSGRKAQSQTSTSKKKEGRKDKKDNKTNTAKVTTMVATDKPDAGKKKKKKGGQKNVSERKMYSEGCPFCGATNHNPAKCPKLSSLSRPERWQSIKHYTETKEICFACLKDGHRVTDCEAYCGKGGCKGRHHAILHQDEQKE